MDFIKITPAVFSKYKDIIAHNPVISNRSSFRYDADFCPLINKRVFFNSDQIIKNESIIKSKRMTERLYVNP